MIYYDKKWDDQWMMGTILLWIYYHQPIIILFTIMINVFFLNDVKYKMIVLLVNWIYYNGYMNGAIWENWDDQWIVLMFLDGKYHYRLMVGWWLMTSATRIILECDLIWQSLIHSTLSSLIKSASLFWRFGDRCTTSHGYPLVNIQKAIENGHL